MPRVRLLLAAVLAAVAVAAAGCATTSARGAGAGTQLRAVASINAWGSILQQLGGTHVTTTSIITNPDTDPHDYEPTPADARTIAEASLVVENGIGYDTWMQKSVAASPNPHRQVIDVGDLVGVAAGGNPHRWYDPTDVATVADAITAALTRADPADAAYFAQQHGTFESSGLGAYHQEIAKIRAAYAGVPIGASESIVSPLADALGLDLVTPPDFLKAISEGTDPSAADKATIDAQISQKKIEVYVVNSQNSTPDVSAQVAAAKAVGIPVCAVTETLSPAGATFQAWQVAQLDALAAALATATGR